MRSTNIAEPSLAIPHRDAERTPVNFIPREPPLAETAVAACGTAAVALVRSLLTRSDASLSSLRGVSANKLVVILGEAAQLPWADGVCYLGRDSAAPSLLLPTTLAPSEDVGLFERALLAAVPPDGAPFAVLAFPPVMVPLVLARVLTRDALRAWLVENATDSAS